MARKIQPVAVLPLDEFGEEVSKRFREVISLTEPGLSQTGQVKILPTWSNENQTPCLKMIEEMASKEGGVQEEYISPTEPVKIVFLFILGSLSLNKEIIFTKLESLKKSLAGVLFHDQVRLVSILDVSEFVGDTTVSSEKAIRELTALLKEIKWYEQVYLTHNYNEYSILYSSREISIEVISLFLEAVTLGHHWEEY